MKSKWLLLLLWTVCGIGLQKIEGQEVKSDNTVAEEWIQVHASSATVLQWFNWIEKETGIVLSYNPAQIEVDKVCRVEKGGRMTVGELLHRILAGYRVQTAFIPPLKLVIQARKVHIKSV